MINSINNEDKIQWGYTGGGTCNRSIKLYWWLHSFSNRLIKSMNVATGF